jgi:hypothetical protein
MLQIFISSSAAGGSQTVKVSLPDGREAETKFSLFAAATAATPGVVATTAPLAGARVPTASPTPSPIPTLGLPTAVFDFSAGVSAAFQADVRAGHTLISSYFAATFGTAAPGQTTITVISSKTLGVPTENSSRADGAHIYTDVDNTSVDNTLVLSGPPPSVSHQKTIAHEYTHVWQFRQGCFATAAPRWFIEGMAEWATYQALSRGGLVSLADVRQRLISQARSSGFPSLRTIENVTDLNTYLIGHLAIERLVALKGTASLTTLCQRIAGSASWAPSFTATYGLTVDAFYADFDHYVRTL